MAGRSTPGIHESIAASPLAATPDALRRACVSTWQSAGVPVTQVAEWTGHSVEVLLKVYAATIESQDDLHRRWVMEAFGYRDGRGRRWGQDGNRQPDTAGLAWMQSDITRSQGDGVALVRSGFR